MEALNSCLTTGEQSGGQEHCRPESHRRGPEPKSPSQPHQQQLPGLPKPHGTPQQPKQPRRQHPERKRLRNQRQSVDSDNASEHKQEAATATKATTASSLPSEELPSSAGGPTQSKAETQEGTPKQKRERKPQRPGKYVCTYCGRACAKPSVLQKHIRSHTGERPYPCAPCGFSFKTKSNLYKHRKSHTHRVKAGLALGEPKSIDEHVTESEDETRQLSTASSHTERQSSVVSTKSHETDRSKDCAGGNDDSYAVKKRLALRLSRGKHAPQDSSDEKASTLISGSKGSTESGYFSRSESTEQSQDSPPNASAKSYAEIILGKYGRLGHLQRIPRHHNQQPSSQEDKSIPFTVPKKQVIDHITKLITINEAVVDTSKIDSVKPRRFSLSRKNSSESQKNSSMKEALIHSPKAGDPGYKNSGSITMGVPCEKFHHASLNVEQPAGQTSAPLVRSHSVPSAASSFDASSGGPSKFRLSQSFDERQPSERQTSRRYGMLKRQPAIEIPLGAELTKEDHEGSCSFYPDSITTVLDHKQPQPYECEACGTGCKDWEGYKKHKQSLCSVHHSRSEVVISQIKCSQLINHAARAGTSAMRKRRKEESFEFDDPSSPSLPSPASFSGQCKDESSVAFEGPRRPTLHTCSVIQHTSSFEKQESLCNEYQGTEATKNSPPHEEYQLVPLKQPQNETAKLTNRKLVRQHNVQVPEILVTEDSNMSTGASKEPTPKTKHSEKHDEFQWPQRSPSLAQLPIEKLPPKKKRLRLAETAQSSGDSSFDSISLPRSPSQDSSASYASSRSTSFEESNRPDMEVATLTPLRKSRAPHMLTVPGVHQHREMRRSASEQAPHDPQPIAQLAETRSKSFDYSCLSPERSAVGWRERRKCLLLRHTAIRDPDEEEEELCAIPSCSPEPVTSSQASPSYVYCSGSPSSPSPGETGLYSPVTLPCKEIFSRWKLSQNIQLTGSSELSLTHCLSADPVKEEALHVQTGQPPPQAPQSYLTHGPSGAARAHYLPMSTGLRLEIPLLHNDYSEVRVSPPHIQLSPPHITSSPELLRPVTSPAVAVRLQTDTLTLACAIYTTLSQSTTPGPKEKLNAVSHNIGIQKAEFRDHRDTSPNLQLWSDDGPRISGSGGNKRMLSPSNSIEILTELQQQQKRVKEEEGEEREVRCVEKTSVETCNEELKQENQSHIPSICSLTTHVGPSFPSLLSSTCNSWCYLNYVKPNPSTLDEQRPSVYSSWSTSGYDPNPPGLSSKTALSLLHCKQRLGPSIYTTSPISARTTESMDQEDHKRPCSTEVYNSQSFCRDNEGRRKGQWSADDNKADQKEEREEEEKEKEAKVQSSSYRVKQPPEAWISERGSNEKYAIEHDGGGRKCQCKDGEFNLKSTSVQQQCTHCIRDDSLPCNCKDCNASFKGKGVYEEPSLHPPKNKARQYTNLERRRHDEDNTRAGSQDEDNRSKAADSSHPSSSDREESQAGRQPVEPEPSQSTLPPRKDSTQKISASTRRGLFAGRHLDASAKASLGGSCSPNAPLLIPQKEPPSPPPRPSSSLSPSSCLVSTFTLRSLSPISPVVAQSCESESSGLPGSLADTSSQCHTCLHSRDWPSTARLSMDEVGVTHVTALAMRPRVAHNLLSHLPLHSQQPSRAPSLLIPIGGIHMIQPRSLLPLYSLVSSPRTATVNPAETSRRLSDALKGRFSLLQHEDTLKETLHHSPASPPDLKSSRGTSKSSQSDVLSHRKSQGCFGIQHTSNPGMETRRPEVNTETERYPETTQGQTKAPSSQTQL